MVTSTNTRKVLDIIDHPILISKNQIQYIGGIYSVDSIVCWFSYMLK